MNELNKLTKKINKSNKKFTEDIEKILEQKNQTIEIEGINQDDNRKENKKSKRNAGDTILIILVCIIYGYFILFNSLYSLLILIGLVWGAYIYLGCSLRSKRNRLIRCSYGGRWKYKTKKEFTINKFLKLRLEEFKYGLYESFGLETNVYIDNKKVSQCKYLLFKITQKDVHLYKNIDSIDEAKEVYSSRGEIPGNNEISPEEEFWGHCSNLQVWYENDYDTRLLHSNISFPLLKKLTEAGDPLAKGVFKEEIINRLESGYIPVITYLILGNYVSFFTKEEREIIVENITKKHSLPTLYERWIKYINLGDLNNDELNYLKENSDISEIKEDELNTPISDFMKKHWKPALFTTLPDSGKLWGKNTKRDIIIRDEKKDSSE